jgi:hypothetical protein
MTETESLYREGFLRFSESIGGTTTDAEGRTVLRGLSFEETELFAADYVAFRMGRPPVLPRDRRNVLDVRWEAARREAILLMVEARGQAKN